MTAVHPAFELREPVVLVTMERGRELFTASNALMHRLDEIGRQGKSASWPKAADAWPPLPSPG